MKKGNCPAELKPHQWNILPQTAPESGSELTSGTHSPYTRVQFSETISERNKGGSILKRFDEPLYEAELRAYWLVNQPYTSYRFTIDLSTNPI